MASVLRFLPVVAFVASLLLSQPSVVSAAGFLEPGGEMSRERILQNLHELLGHSQDGDRMDRLRDVLRPTFMAMPKNAVGGLDHRVARYALHRYFIVQHAWHIKGLSLDTPKEPESNSLAVMLESRMPSMILDMLDGELHGGRLGLDELAVLAATIEDLVHSDSVDLLQRAYQAHGLSTSDALSASDADLVIRTFTLWFVIPTLQKWSTPNFSRVLRNASSVYPGWEDTLVWIEDLKMGAMYMNVRSRSSPFATEASDDHDGHMDFPAMVHWATDVSAGFGRFSNLECKAMRSKLTDLDEGRGDGRVRLGMFYSPALDGSGLHFSESPDYLRHLGALDESSTAGHGSVIIPNILYSRSNCLANSGFNSVCCIDECQVLMSQVEERISNPMAEPHALVEAVSGLSSDTVAGPREIPQHLRQRLQDIASRHGGSTVPLHGRLFAQWMHYAFPNECPYPSSLLTSESSMSPAEWHAHWNRTKSSTASTEEMQVLRDSMHPVEADLEVGSTEEAVLWSEDEELLSDLGFATQTWAGTAWHLFRSVAMLAAVVATAVSLYQSSKTSPAWAQKKGEAPMLTPSFWGAGMDEKQHIV